MTENKHTAPKIPYARTVTIPKTQTGVCDCEEPSPPEKFRGMRETFSRVLITPVKKIFINLPIPIISSFCSLHCFI